MTTSAVCGTDLALVRGMYGFHGVPGHEFVGIVEAGPDTLAGRRVVGEINCACGRCGECLAGRSKHCERRRVLGIRGRDGAFAERLSLPASNLHLVPEHVDDEEAVLTEPLAAALDIPRRILVGPRDRVLVVGAGRLGQLVARVLAGAAGSLDVLGRDARKLARLPSTVTGLDALDPGARYDVVVDASGTPGGLATALGAVRPQGTLVVKSTFPERPSIDLTRVVVDEIRVVGSRCGPFEEALALLAGGGLDLSSLVDGHYPLDRAEDALRHAGSPGAIKVLIDNDGALAR